MNERKSEANLLQNVLPSDEFAKLLFQGYALSDVAELYNVDFVDVYTLFCQNKSHITNSIQQNSSQSLYQIRFFSRKFLLSALMRLKSVHAIAQRYNTTYYEVIKELNNYNLDPYIPLFKNKLEFKTLKILYLEKHFSDDLIGRIFNMTPRTIALERRKYNISAHEEKENLTNRLVAGLYYDLAVNYRLPIDKIMEVTGASKNILSCVKKQLLQTLSNEEIKKLTVWDNNKNNDTIFVALIRKKFYLNQL